MSMIPVIRREVVNSIINQHTLSDYPRLGAVLMLPNLQWKGASMNSSQRVVHSNDSWKTIKWCPCLAAPGCGSQQDSILQVKFTQTTPNIS